MVNNSENQNNYKRNEEQNRDQQIQELVQKCRQTAEQKSEPFVSSRDCGRESAPIHFSCVAHLIVNNLNSPCGWCGKRFRDQRITRYPTFKAFITRGAGIVFTILFFVLNIQFMNEMRFEEQSNYRSHTRRKDIKSSPIAVIFVASLFNSILFQLALISYRNWFRFPQRTVVLEGIINGQPFRQYLDLNTGLELPERVSQQTQQFNSKSLLPGFQIFSIDDQPVVGRFDGVDSDMNDDRPASGTQNSNTNKNRSRSGQPARRRHSL